MTVRVLSFHSVKGGVGKSTLATLAAVRLAQQHPQAQVWLVDMDLTGTSLADALPLRAPCWGDPHAPGPVDLRTPPDGTLELEETRARLERRGVDQKHPGPPQHAPLLNDWLLYADPSWDPEQDARVEAVAWSLEGGPANLRVLPSSALPRDLAWILPVIFDEEHAAFLEGRLELLLAAIARAAPEAWVVFDVPPTIPGLSRALLGLALRLAHPTRPQVPLATQDPWIPPELTGGHLRWVAGLVATLDHQDLRAASRWVAELSPEDAAVFQVIINRAEGDARTWEHELQRALGDLVLSPDPLWTGCVFVEDSPDLRLFRGGGLARLPEHPLLEKLQERLP